MSSIKHPNMSHDSCTHEETTRLTKFQEELEREKNPMKLMHPNKTTPNKPSLEIIERNPSQRKN